MALAKATASLEQSGYLPNMMGVMGCTPGMMSKPAAVIFSRKYMVFRSSLSRRAVVEESMSMTRMVASTTDGATVLENRYGRALFRIQSMISFRPEMQPPDAPP